MGGNFWQQRIEQFDTVVEGSVNLQSMTYLLVSWPSDTLIILAAWPALSVKLF